MQPRMHPEGERRVQEPTDETSRPAPAAPRLAPGGEGGGLTRPPAPTASCFRVPRQGRGPGPDPLRRGPLGKRRRRTWTWRAEGRPEGPFGTLKVGSPHPHSAPGAREAERTPRTLSQRTIDEDEPDSLSPSGTLLSSLFLPSWVPSLPHGSSLRRGTHPSPLPSPPLSPLRITRRRRRKSAARVPPSTHRAHIALRSSRASKTSS